MPYATRSKSENKMDQATMEEILARMSRDIVAEVQKKIERVEVAHQARLEAIEGVIQRDENGRWEETIVQPNVGPIVQMESFKASFFFDGSDDVNPIEFLNNFERKFAGYRDEHRKLELLEQHLKGRALTWYKFILEDTQGYANIKNRFKKYFWGEKEQEQVINRLKTGKYTFEGKEGPDEYCIRLYQTCKEVDAFPLSEGSKIRQISRHFGESFATAVVIQGVETFSKLLDCLNRFPVETLRRECRATEFRRGGHNNRVAGMGDRGEIGDQKSYPQGYHNPRGAGPTRRWDNQYYQGTPRREVERARPQEWKRPGPDQKGGSPSANWSGNQQGFRGSPSKGNNSKN